MLFSVVSFFKFVNFTLLFTHDKNEHPPFILAPILFILGGRASPVGKLPGVTKSLMNKILVRLVKIFCVKLFFFLV